MKNGTTNLMYVAGTILVMLSVAIIANGVLTSENLAWNTQPISAALAGVIMPGERPVGTLYDTYCYAHNTYFGLRF